MLTNLERLEEIAYNDNIKIYNYHISDTKKACCYCDKDFKAISLDKPMISSKAEETELLAEEIGHFKTGGLYSLSSNYNTLSERQNRLICEAKARSWAINKILPPCLIVNGILNGYTNCYELADYCDVTLDFFNKAISYYETKGIVFFNGDFELLN